MLTTDAANAKTESLNKSFADIGGKADGTSMPRSRGNLEPLAWDVFCAKHLKRLADAREKKAVAAAVKAGVMFDPEKQPAPVGTAALVYAGDVIEIGVEVTTPRTRLETDELFADLVKTGVPQKTLDRLVAKHTHDNRAPHKFTATLVTSR